MPTFLVCPNTHKKTYSLAIAPLSRHNQTGPYKACGLGVLRAGVLFCAAATATTAAEPVAAAEHHAAGSAGSAGSAASTAADTGHGDASSGPQPVSPGHTGHGGSHHGAGHGGAPPGSSAITAISYSRNFPQAPSHTLSQFQNQEERLPRLRPVLKGALFRSGTPSDEALGYLCENNWKRVYSLYGEHTTQEGPRNVNMLRHGRDTRTCTPPGAAEGKGSPRSIEWRSAPSSRMRNLPMIFKDILDTIRNPQHGPVLVHCWNGLHYAGMVSALALRQFCGLTAEQSEAYWRANANRGANYPLIIANLYQFKPVEGLTLTPEEQAAVCPDLSKSLILTAESFNGTPSPGPQNGIYAAASESMSRATPPPALSLPATPAGAGGLLPASTPAQPDRSAPAPATVPGPAGDAQRATPALLPASPDGSRRGAPTSAGVSPATSRSLPAKG